MHGGPRDEGGYALIITVVMALVVGALAVTLVVASESGMRQSRRSGDSANALQVADAGINAAAKRVVNEPGTSFTLATTLAGTGDGYTVTATKAATGGTWYLDSVGTDAEGVSRRVRAEARPEALFEYGVFAKTLVEFGSGVAVDSYSGGLNPAQTCTGRGFVGTNDPAGNDLNVQGGGGGVRNCTSQIGNPSPPYPSSNPRGYVYDGCVGYGDADPVPRFKNEAANDTKRTCGTIAYRTPKRDIDSDLDGMPATSGGALVCSGPNPLAPGAHRFASIDLRDGCVFNGAGVSQANPVKLYTTGTVSIGTSSNKARVNGPAAGCAGTAAVGDDYFGGNQKSPLSDYCSGWPGRLRVITSSSSPVNFGGHTGFWGLLSAPNAPLGGGPQPVIFGAFQSSSIVTGAQFLVHFDERLFDLTNGRFQVAVWREAPLP